MSVRICSPARMQAKMAMVEAKGISPALPGRGDAEHVLLGDAHVVKAVREGLGEMDDGRGLGKVGGEADDLFVVLAQFGQRAAVDLAGGHGRRIVGVPVGSGHDCHIILLQDRSLGAGAQLRIGGRVVVDGRCFREVHALALDGVGEDEHGHVRGGPCLGKRLVELVKIVAVHFDETPSQRRATCPRTVPA